MKKLILISSIFSLCTAAAVAQNKPDTSIAKKDIEAIRKDLPPPKPEEKQSIMRVDHTIPAKVDTAALKPDFPQPIPPSPNNPNPYEPHPSVINPHPPANPPKTPDIPPGTPTGPDQT